MDIKELRDKTDHELQRLLSERRNRLRDLRFRVAARQLGDVREVREARQAVAQILTVLGERQRSAAQQPTPAAESKEKEPPAKAEKQAAGAAPKGA